MATQSPGAAEPEPKPIRPRRRLPFMAVLGLAFLAGAAGGTGTGAALLAGRIEATLPPSPSADVLPVSAVVLDRTDRLLRPFTTLTGTWRLPVGHEAVDPLFLAMLLEYEDRRFRAHRGVDWRAALRAAGQLAWNGRIVSGASTLTMQVARLLEGAPTRRATAKLRQIVRARRLERDLGKDAILDLYLTLAPYGGNIEGIRAATLAYFGKEPARLTAGQAALLVALPQAPEARRPDRHPRAARAARDRVLARMTGAGLITEAEADAARQEPVPNRRRPFPMLAAHLGQQAVAALPAKRVHRLTVERDLQAALEGLAGARALRLGQRQSIAILVADHRSGEILASVGSTGLLDERRAGHVDMTRAMRSPGSTLKPFIYGLAFEAGLAHPESLIEDRPTAFAGYVPANFDGFSRGTVTIREALTESLNVPAVVVLDAVGPARLVARLKRAGAQPALPDLSAPGLAVGLGGIGISLRDLVTAYAALSEGGRAVTLSDGIAPPVPPSPVPVLAAPAAWYVADILSGTPPPATGRAGRIAYKTGTSYGYRDAWAIGFDGRHVIGVWVGRPDGAPVPGLSGATEAAPILFEAFDRLKRRTVPLLRAPAGVLTAKAGALPEPLRRFRHPDAAVVARQAAPEIAFPPDGVRVDLGLAAADAGPLAIKVRNGAPPFTFLVNGAPVDRSAFARTGSYRPDGPGFVTIAVIDGNGQSDRVTVFVE